VSGEEALNRRKWKTWHLQNARCDINYVVSQEKHVDIMEFKPEYSSVKLWDLTEIF